MTQHAPEGAPLVTDDMLARALAAFGSSTPWPAAKQRLKMRAALEAAALAQQERAIAEIVKRARIARSSWVLGDSAPIVFTALLGVAHDLDHGEECEDSTTDHLWHWAAERSRR